MTNTLEKTIYKNDSFTIKSIWLIKEGFAYSRSITDNGEYLILGIWGKGDYLIHPENIASFDIKAISKVVMEEVSIDTLDKLKLIDTFRKSHNFLQISRIPLIKNRIVELMNWLSTHYGFQMSQKDKKINFKLTQDEISYALNTTRVTVTRNLGELEKEGTLVIRKSGDSMLVSTR